MYKENDSNEALILRDEAMNQLQQIKTIETGVEYLNKVKAIEIWVKAEKKDAELQNIVAEQKLRAQRILGRLIKEGQHAGEIASQGQSYGNLSCTNDVHEKPKTLTELGISRNQSSIYQKISDIPEPLFEEYIADKKAAVENDVAELTTSGILSFSKPKKQPREEINNIPLPSGVYTVIYIDPPWPVSETSWNKWDSPITDKYPTMSIDEITAIDVPSISHENSCLFIWTTQRFLHDTFHIIEAWGFKYYCTITWDKGSGWTQDGFHKNTEFLLFAYKGKMTIKETGVAIPSIIYEKKGEHSKKPDSIRELIESKTNGSRIEMFARQKYDNWQVWGNEV